MNYVVTRESPGELQTLVRQLRGKNVRKLILTFMEPYAEGAIELAPDAATLANLRGQIAALVDEADFAVDVEGFPLCHMDVGAMGVSSRRDDIRLNRRIPKISISPKADADYLSVHYGYQRYLQYVKLAGCEGCAKAQGCPGIHQLLRDRLLPQPFHS